MHIDIFVTFAKNLIVHTMKKIKCMLVAAALLAGASMQAQNFSFRFGGHMLLGDLAESQTVTSFLDNAKAGNAAGYGASLGFQFSLDVTDGLAAFVSADAIWTPSNKEIRKMYDEHSWTKPQFINVPVLAGLVYTLPASSVAPYFEAGLGVNFFVKTPEGVSGNLMKYDMTESFAVDGGLGLLFGSVFSVGVHYLLPGIDGVKISTQDVNADYDLKASIVSLRLGFHF